MSNSFEPFQWRWNSQQDTPQDAFRVNSVQSFIDAARLEGIRLGLEAAERIAGPRIGYPRESEMRAAIRALDPETIAREAVLDQLTSEAQAQKMGYEND